MDGKQVEGTWRAHQVPLEEVRTNPEHLKLLEEWLRSYRPEELFDQNGTLRSELADIAPKGRLRMGMNQHANGGQLLQPLVMPDFRQYAVACPSDNGDQRDGYSWKHAARCCGEQSPIAQLSCLRSG